MPKTSINIYLRKDGRYEGRYLKDNKTGKKTKYGYVYGTTYEETYIKLLRKKKDYEQERSVNDNRFLTIDKLIKSWLFSISGTVKPGTFSTYQNYVNTYLIPKIGSVYAVEFDKYALEAFLLSLQKESKTGKEPAENTLYLLEEILHLIFKYGQENYLIPSTEFERTVNRKKDKKEVVLLSEQEKKRLIEVACQKEIDVQLSILLPLYTGINLSELCGLKWEDFDLEQGRMRIIRGVKRVQNQKGEGIMPTSLVEYNLKEECREFLLPEYILKLLRKANSFISTKIENMDGDSNKNVQIEIQERRQQIYVATLDKKRPEGRTLQYRLDHIGYEAGIEKVNFRMLRDTFAVKCLQAGGDIYSLAYVLGVGINIACERYRNWIVRDDELLKRIG